MDKWADYLISEVSYNNERTHISKVKAHEDKGDSVGPAEECSREAIVKVIKQGTTFVTIFKGQNGKWNKGKDVHIIKIGTEEFLRTDQNQRKVDNLENLPEF